MRDGGKRVSFSHFGKIEAMMPQHTNGLRPTCNAWVQLGGLRFACARQGARAHRHHWYVKIFSDGTRTITISWDEP